MPMSGLIVISKDLVNAPTEWVNLFSHENDGKWMSQMIGKIKKLACVY
jgi:hypothetical protein